MKPFRTHTAALLGRTALFRDLTDQQLERLAAATRERRFAKGELVFQKGDRPTGLFVVVAGQIKEACQSPSGGEKIVEMLGPHQTCGEAALFLDCPYPFFVATLGPTLLLQIEKKAIMELVDSEPELVKCMLSQLSMRLYAIVRDVEAYTLHNPLQRVVGYLLEQNFASAKLPGATSFILPATKSVIASRLGVTPEAMSRALRDLIDAGLIEVRSNRVKILDLQRVKTFAQ